MHALVWGALSFGSIRGLLAQDVGGDGAPAAPAGPSPRLVDVPKFHRDEYEKLAALIDHVHIWVAESSDGCAVLDAIADFAANIGQWLKVAGGTKSECVRDQVCSCLPGLAEISTELGAFVGYSTARISCLVSSKVIGVQGRCICHASIELDPVHVCVVRHHVSLAKPAAAVRVVVGRVTDAAPLLAEEFGMESVKFSFMDHRGTRFHEESAWLARLRLAAPKAHTLADNVLEPGAPVFCWEVSCQGGGTAWALREFLRERAEDWMVACNLHGGAARMNRLP